MKELKRIKKEIINEVYHNHKYDNMGCVRFHIPDEEKKEMVKEVKKRMNEIKSVDINLIKRNGKIEWVDKDIMTISYKDCIYEIFEDDYSKVLFVTPDFSEYTYQYEIVPMGKFINRFKSEEKSNDIKSEENESK